jgi:hypothetical protein
MSLFDFIPSSRAEGVTDIVAGAAVVSPWWLPWLKEFSDIAGYLVPVAGLIWLIVQIGVKIHTTYWRRK